MSKGAAPRPLAFAVTAGDDRRTGIAAASAEIVRETVRHEVRKCAWPGTLLDG